MGDGHINPKGHGLMTRIMGKKKHPTAQRLCHTLGRMGVPSTLLLSNIGNMLENIGTYCKILEIMGMYNPLGIYNQLVGGWATPLKNMNVNWDDEIPNIWENKKWQPNRQLVKYGLSQMLHVWNIYLQNWVIFGVKCR